MEQQTILVPLDGSAASEAAIPYGAALARANHVPIRLLRVITSIEQYAIFESPEEELAAIDRVRHDAEAELDAPAAELRGQGFEVSTAIATGNPAEEILHDAKMAHAAAIVMATHGRGGVERWALGSVADKVMRMSPVPTLLVRPPQAGAQPKLTELHTILLPLDGSPLAETAIEPAAALARATGAELLVLRIEPYLSQALSMAGDGYYIPDLDAIEAETAAAARAYVQGVCAGLGEGIRYRGFVERGFASQLLEPFIADNRVDLVVMSTHGHGGLTRLVIGSTADRLVRAGVPCLLIHPPALPHQPAGPKEVAAAR